MRNMSSGIKIRNYLFSRTTSNLIRNCTQRYTISAIVGTALDDDAISGAVA